MRGKDKAIPKVILTITDGRSSEPEATIAYARALKKREFNMISVGVGDNIASDELFELSTTSSNQFFAEDFMKIFDIIVELTYTSCRMKTSIKEDQKVETTVKKDSYKYFKYSVETSEDLTIELEKLSGNSEVFFSFENEFPKSDADLVVNNEPDNKPNENFNEIEDQRLFPINIKTLAQLTKSVAPAIVKNSEKSTLYAVKNTNRDDTLYLSVKGYEETNTFKVNVFNKSIVIQKNNGQTSVYMGNLSTNFLVILIGFVGLIQQSIY